MTETEKQKMYLEFVELCELKQKLRKKRDRLDKECDNNKTYTKEKYEEVSNIIKQIMDIDKKIDANVEERKAKGYLIIQF